MALLVLKAQSKCANMQPPECFPNTNTGLFALLVQYLCEYFSDLAGSYTTRGKLKN